MNTSFLSPAALLLLLPASLLVFLTARKSLAGLPRPSLVLAVALRIAIVFCLVFALAEIQVVATARSFQVLFLLDRSESIPDDVGKDALQAIRQLAGFQSESDRSGALVFGANTGVEEVLSDRLRFTTPRALIDPNRTAIGQAIDRAAGMFTPGGIRRIVVLTDGNENVGSAENAARKARSRGIFVDVFPLRFRHEPEIHVEKLVTPKAARKGEPFAIKVVLNAAGIDSTTLNLYQDGALIARETMTLSPGINALVLNHDLPDAGFHRFEVVAESQDDTLSQNNRAVSFTDVRGNPQVLHVRGDEDVEIPFLTATNRQKIEVTTIIPENVPSRPTDLFNYQTLLLSNVDASRLTQRQMRAIESYVRHLGGGLLVLGGDRAFAAGGYQGSPIEEALPLFMESDQDQVLPRGALAICLHTCEFPDGNRWAKEISKAALRVLSSRDLFGVLSFDPRAGGDVWSIPLRSAKDKPPIESMIDTLDPGDMPSFNPSLSLAHQQLALADAAVKHLIVISDGDPSRPDPSLVTAIVEAKITVSTVCINPHGENDTEVMEALATIGNGSYYRVDDARRLPEIFIREASVIRKPAIFEEPFQPRVGPQAQILRGIPVDTMPQLLGYVLTSPKPTAEIALVSHTGNPLLALGRHGLGKTVAFTSDASSRWCSPWLDWPGYVPLLQQALFHTISLDRGPLDVEIETDGKIARIILDAVTEDGAILSDLHATATLVTPSFHSHEIPLRQVEPGRYEAETPIAEDGAHLVKVTARSLGNRGGDLLHSATLGFFPTGSQEFADLRENESVLQAIARAGSGRILTGEENVFADTSEEAPAPRELWPVLLAISLLLIPIDVFFRRVIPNWERVLGTFSRKRSREESAPAPAPSPPVATEVETPGSPSPEPDPSDEREVTREERNRRLLEAKRRATRRTRPDDS